MLSIRGSLISQPTRAVLWTCALTGTRYDFKPVEGGEQASDEYRKKLNPNGKFPVLIDGDFVLWESHAIMRYVASSAGNTDWYPADAQGRATVDAWLDWKHSHLRVGAAGLVRRRVMARIMDTSKHSMRFALKEVDAAFEERALAESLAVMDGALAPGKFLAGLGRPTIADLACFEELEQVVAFLPEAGPPPEGGDLSGFPNIVSWMAEIRQLPDFEAQHAVLHKTGKKLAKMRLKGKL